MSGDGKALERLKGLIKEGAREAAARLASVSGIDWHPENTALADNAVPQDYLLQAGREDQSGTFFTFEGGACLVVYHRKSGLLLANRMMRDAPPEVETLYKLEPQALSEASNILASAFLSPLSCALGRAIILSAPKAMTGKREELLARAMGEIPDPAAYPLRGYARLAAPKLSADCALLLMLSPETLK